MLEKINVLDVGITNATKKEVLEYLVKNVINFRKKLFIVTPNPEFLVLASENLQFKNILNKADLASADGVGVMIAAKILGRPLKERLTGVDMVESLCGEVSEKPITVGFLGGGDGVAEKTAECLQKKHPKLKIGFIGEEWPEDKFDLHGIHGKTQNDTRKNAERVNSVVQRSVQHGSATIDILFVAFGAPKQEMWINENLQNLPVKVAIGVGGAFDYISGKTPRAPLFLRSIGFEWLYRLVIQPWRIKRQLSLVKFIWLVVKEKFKNLLSLGEQN